jgi:hypothetical protein
MPKSEFEALPDAIKRWVDEPFDKLPPEIQTIVRRCLPQRKDPRFLLPPRRFVSVWDMLEPNERLKAAELAETALELGFLGAAAPSRDIDARLNDIYAWEISRFGIVAADTRPMEPANIGGDEPRPEIPAWLSPMESPHMRRPKIPGWSPVVRPMVWDANYLISKCEHLNPGRSARPGCSKKQLSCYESVKS